MTHLRMLGRRVSPFAVAMLTVAGVAAAAMAGGPSSRAQSQDPNDTGGLLDVRRVWFEPEIHPPRWTIVTFSPFTAEATRDRGFVFVYLDTIGDQGFDYYALIRSNGRHLSGSLWRHPMRGTDVRLMELDARRTSDNDVSLRIPLGRLEIGGFRAVYRWSVVTTFTGRVCRATCVDRVPDEGAFEQPIGSPTPAPTTTPTATPTATPTGTPTAPPSVAAPRSSPVDQERSR